MPTPPEPAPTVSVVIPTRGRRPEVLNLSVTRLSSEACVREVILVDDSGLATLTLGRGRDTAISVIEARGRGPNSSRQAGLEASTGDLILFLDDDVLPDSNLASLHAARHAVHRRAVVVGYMPVAQEHSGFYASAASQLYAVEYERRVAGYESDPSTILQNLWGGNISLQRADAIRVGVENLSYPGHRHEDQDFGLRCAQAGLTGVFDRSLRATHHYRRSRRDFLRDAWAQGYERATLARSHPGATWYRTGSHASPHAEPQLLGPLTHRRHADIVMLKAARRIELWRGRVSANRNIPQSGDGAWRHQ